MELLYKSCYGLTTVLGVAQGLFVLCKNPRSRVNVTWALLSLAVAMWALEGQCFFEPNYKRALYGWRLFNSAAIFIPVFFTHFCLALLDKPLRESRVAITGYCFATVIASFAWTPWYIPKVSHKLVFQNYVNPGPLYVAFTILFFILGFYSHWLLFQHLHEQRRERQNQIKYVALATIVGYVCGSTTFLLVYGIPFNPLPSLFTWVYALIITYAIVKHQLMDIKVAITRTGVLLATYLVVLGLPFVVGWWGKEWLKQQVGDEWWLVPLGLCTVLATIGPFAYAFLRRQAERALLKEQQRYQRTLQLAARGMTRVRDLGKLSRLIARVVSRTIRVQHASLFLWDKGGQRYVLAASHGPKHFAVPSHYGLEPLHPLVRWLYEERRALSKDEAAASRPALATALEGLNAALVIPGVMEHELLGFLVLGDKRSGAAYSADDLHAFSTLAHEAAIALENASSYGELFKLNDQLRAAYARLLTQERFAAAGQFATGMAHEIKNPLSAIKTFAEYLPEKYQDPEFRSKFFRIVQSEIDRINTLLKDLLEFAKPAKPELEPVRIAVLLEETLTLLSSRLLAKGVELRRAFQENGLMIQADPKQLKQVLLNLILNSLDAMPDGGRLEVSTQAREGWLILQISDTGCGIHSEHQHQVFDPFFTTKERGMGLGLAVVKGIVDRHGGQIFIRSDPGQGTTAELMLPVMQRT